MATHLSGNGGELNLSAELALPLAVLQDIVHEAGVSDSHR